MQPEGRRGADYRHWRIALNDPWAHDVIAEAQGGWQVAPGHGQGEENIKRGSENHRAMVPVDIWVESETELRAKTGDREDLELGHEVFRFIMVTGIMDGIIRVTSHSRQEYDEALERIRAHAGGECKSGWTRG